MPWLGALLAQLLGTAGARILTGLGLGLVTMAATMPMVNSALVTLRNMVGGITADILHVMLIAGMGDVFSMLGSAIVTRTAIQAGRAALVRRA